MAAVKLFLAPYRLPLVAMMALLALSACSTSDGAIFSRPPTVDEQIKSAAERRKKGAIPPDVKIGKAYDINGIRYEPRYQPSYVAEGIASWYGPGFHGKSTANGERYNSYDYTAAHPTLPIPSLVRVTNLKNNKQIVARVNDRGPFARGRIIDLSKSSAAALDVIGAGTAPVRLEYLDKDTRRLWAAMHAKNQPSQAYAYYAQEDIIYDDRQQLAVMQEAPKPLMDDEILAQQAAVDETLAPLLAMDDAMLNEDAEPAGLYPPEPTGQRSYASNRSSHVTTREAAPVQQVAPAAGRASGGASVQVASYANRHNAEQAAFKLAQLGDAFIQEAVISGKRYYRVKIRPENGDAGLSDLLANARQAGFRDAIISR